MFRSSTHLAGALRQNGPHWAAYLRAWAVLLGASGCSLVIGDIPGPLPDDVVEGPVADAGTRDAGIGSSEPDADTASPAASVPGRPDEGDDVIESPDDAGAAPSTSAPASALDAEAPGGMSERDSGIPEPQIDGGARGDCDRDRDGESSEACGGNDCDDDDPQVHPGQTRYFTEANERVGFDYDCDDMIARPPLETTLSCSLELAQCNIEAQGFLGDSLPPCGQPGDWGRCVKEEVVGGLSAMCAEQKDEERRAACR